MIGRIMRKNLTVLHIVVGSFFLPVGLIFAITGALYTIGVKGGYDSSSWMIQTETAIAAELPEALSYAEPELLKKNLPQPTGSASIKRVGSSWQLEWTGSHADFILEPTAQANEYKLTYKKTTWHRFFVQFHKAKGGWPFKALAVGFGLGLIFLLISGTLMSLASPVYTRLMLASFSCGVILTLGALFLS